MSQLDREVLAEKAAVIERHLSRVIERLPEDPEDLQPMSDASDAVILHLWQAVQMIHWTRGIGLPPPESWQSIHLRRAFQKLARAGFLDPDLAARLVRAAGFRNVVAHTYETLDMARVYRAAKEGPADLRAFLAALERFV